MYMYTHIPQYMQCTWPHSIQCRPSHLLSLSSSTIPQLKCGLWTLHGRRRGWEQGYMYMYVLYSVESTVLHSPGYPGLCVWPPAVCPPVQLSHSSLRSLNLWGPPNMDSQRWYMEQCSVHSNCVSHLIHQVNICPHLHQLPQSSRPIAHGGSDGCSVPSLWREWELNEYWTCHWVLRENGTQRILDTKNVGKCNDIANNYIIYI